jgi:hypothetical protein
MKTRKNKTTISFKLENTASIQPAIAELERVFQALASRFAALTGRPYPRIVIQSRGRRQGAMGWFAREKWRNGQADMPAIHEITIAAESLSRPVLLIVATLIHEMVHLACYYGGIQDVGKDGRYHNLRFKEAAEAVGLLVEKDLRIGWSLTRLGPALETMVSSLNVNADAFAVFRLGEREREKQPTKMKKWVCACPVIVRCAVEMHGHCDDCGEPWRLAEALSPPVARAA